MNIEKQVCDFEYAKRLDELGVKQDSYFSYVKLNDNKISIWQSDKLNNRICYAFTASELFDILPHRITLIEDEPFNTFRLQINKSFVCEDMHNKLKYTYIINYYCDSTAYTGESAWLGRALFNHSIWDESLANASAKVLIHIIENGYIKNE